MCCMRKREREREREGRKSQINRNPVSISDSIDPILALAVMGRKEVELALGILSLITT